ncbi:hypothetical protein [Cupriavidus necator]
MYWSNHVINPTDASWDCLLTVSETAERIARIEARAKIADRHASVNELATFLDLYESAKVAAKFAGWIDPHLEPVVFWVPIENDVSMGFAFRQADGKALILSPLPLPHLDAEPDPIED